MFYTKNYGMVSGWQELQMLAHAEWTYEREHGRYGKRRKHKQYKDKEQDTQQ